VRPASLAPLAGLVLLACGSLSEVHQARMFAAAPVDGEKLADLPSLPADVTIAADGAWETSAAAPPPPAAPPPFRMAGETLLLRIGSRGYDARIERVRAPDGSPEVAWSDAAGVLVAATRGGRAHQGTDLVTVAMREGTTRAVGSWEMDEDEGYQAIEAMRVSPDGRFLACQMVEKHPGGPHGHREVARRGLVVPLDAGAGRVIDLGPAVRGPMAWGPDGRDLYFLRAARAVALYRVRLPGPAPATSVASATSAAAARPVTSVGAPSPPLPAAAPAAPTAPSPRAAERRWASQQEVLDPIMQLASGNPTERIAAAETLERLPHPMAVGPLINAMGEGDPGLCRAADEALRNILTPPPSLSIGGAGAEECSRAARQWHDYWSAHRGAVDR
jgi:hypothetical protein